MQWPVTRCVLSTRPGSRWPMGRVVGRVRSCSHRVAPRPTTSRSPAGCPRVPGVPVCSAVEHPAVLETARVLGGRVVAVDRGGRSTSGRSGRPRQSRVLTQRTLLRVRRGPFPCQIRSDAVSVVSVMTANNELGTINDIDAVAELVRRCAPGVPVHTDAVQAAPWLDLAVVGEVGRPRERFGAQAGWAQGRRSARGTPGDRRGTVAARRRSGARAARWHPQHRRDRRIRGCAVGRGGQRTERARRVRATA